ncbi:DUF3710 domain-containing protein [Sphaerimonospora thailandensis]|uniref:DUF3710 domain-containing protein n=1 Tax=Sphaerimonospora thailandensis TaxID=795644 RepID=A0A8J3R558_9ACTN|nr:DUF3710 domain-containing protein [Sphaerimonospora thailandensis]GIH69401.1 hypothetical protein Mth01_16540 [Sphaerimonospora thailandensis]
MFRRRRHAEEETAPVVAEVAEEPTARTSGPWDAQDAYPEAERVDLGGLLLPIGPRFEIQLSVTGDHIDGAIVLVEESALRVQAMAAPKRSGIWGEVRAEIAREVTAAGGTVQEQEGPFGAELAARMPQAPGEAPQPVRYLGIDGPRWLLRAMISGRAALDSTAAEIVENVVRDIVVVRGDEPMPPRETIHLRLPAEARQAMEQQAAPQGELRPFERGPEITETR